MGDETPTFDPASLYERLIQIRGRGGPADYMNVAWRLFWFRAEWPRGQIETEHIIASEEIAVFRATIRKTDADGVINGTATGYGSETPGDFTDYVEKAETKAIGRALHHLGFDVIFLPEDVQQRAATSAPPPQQPQARPAPSKPAAKPPNDDEPMSTTQEQAIIRLATRAGFVNDQQALDKPRLAQEVERMVGAKLNDLTVGQAGRVIQLLQTIQSPEKPQEGSNGQHATQDTQATPNDAQRRSGSAGGASGSKATDNQLNYIRGLGRQANWSDDDLVSEIMRMFEVGDLESLTRADASAFIEYLKNQVIPDEGY